MAGFVDFATRAKKVPVGVEYIESRSEILPIDIFESKLGVDYVSGTSIVEFVMLWL